MAEKKIFTVTDLGGGDGGKGGIVHKVCEIKKAHTVIKVGGAQGSHGVRTARGQSFNFSQFGCGTFEGVKTHISDLMVIEPYRFLCEADSLKYEWGISNIFSYLTVDEDALCITPFHTIASRLKELARKDNPKGTIGVGAGETVIDSEAHPELIIRAGDIKKTDLRDKLEAVRLQKLEDLSEIIGNVHELWPADQDCAIEHIELLNDPDFINRIVEKFETFGSLAKIVANDYLEKEILSRDGVVVVESSHGILTDKYYGFHPHTSRLRTIPAGTLDMLSKSHYTGEIIKLGVTRAYQIRHGAGPMVTESSEFIDKLLPGSNKDENRWQGKVRVGPLDFVALRYAVDVCGGPQAFDGLAVTWFDQIQTLGKWNICNSYSGADDQDFFLSDKRIKVQHGIGIEQVKRQEQLGKLLSSCHPNLIAYDVPPATNKKDSISLCSEVFQDNLNIPVKMISFGPTETDKACL